MLAHEEALESLLLYTKCSPVMTQHLKKNVDLFTPASKGQNDCINVVGGKFFGKGLPMSNTKWNTNVQISVSFLYLLL